MEELYRFRSTKALLDGYNELEKQEFYFATSEQLNDPMEGLKKVIWDGDGIIWQKLLEHYVHCLAHMVCLSGVAPPGYLLSNKDMPFIPAELSYAQNLYNNFLSVREVQSYLSYRNSQFNRPSNKEELYTHLLFLHRYAYVTVIKTLKNIGACPPNIIELPDSNNEHILNYFNYLSSTPIKHEEDIQNMQMANMVNATFYDAINLELKQSYKVDYNLSFISRDFTKEYVNLLERNIYSNFGAVCFISDCNNVAMWSYYADNHKGVALKFKTSLNHSNNPAIKAYDINGHNMDGADYEFKKIAYGYDNFDIKINFFKNLGKLSMAELSKWWYCLRNHQTSLCAHDIFEDWSNWHKKYWQYHENCITTKHKDWNHENEYRLIKSLSGDRNEQTIKYRFEDLDGIIFGIKTSDEDKISIMRIIKAKCRSILEKVQDFVNNNRPLDYQAQNELHTILHLHCNVLFAGECGKIANVINVITSNNIHSDEYKAILRELCDNPTFKSLTSKHKRDEFKFYQASYCIEEHKMKYDSIISIPFKL